MNILYFTFLYYCVKDNQSTNEIKKVSCLIVISILTVKVQRLTQTVTAFKINAQNFKEKKYKKTEN